MCTPHPHPHHGSGLREPCIHIMKELVVKRTLAAPDVFSIDVGYVLFPYCNQILTKDSSHLALAHFASHRCGPSSIPGLSRGRMCEKFHQLLAVGRWFPPGTPVSSTRKLISSSFDRLDMTLAVAEALNPNKPNQPLLLMAMCHNHIQVWTFINQTSLFYLWPCVTTTSKYGRL